MSQNTNKAKKEQNKTNKPKQNKTKQKQQTKHQLPVYLFVSL